MAVDEPEDMEWFEAGKCRMLYKLGVLQDPEIFFPEKGASTQPAKEVCLGYDGRPRCEVVETCKKHAIENERYGVWGGLSERERSIARREERRRERVQRRTVVRRNVTWEDVQ